MDDTFKKLVNYSFDILAILDINGNFKFVNRAFLEKLGWSSLELAGRNFQELIVFKEQETSLNILRNLSSGHPIIFSEGQFRYRNGIIRSIHWTAYPDLEAQVVFLIIHDANHEVTGQEIFKMAVDASPTVIFIVKDGTFHYANLLAEKVFGYLQDEFIGMSIETLVPPRMYDVHHTHRDQYVQQPYTRLMGSALELTGVRKNGEEFPLDIGLNPVNGPEGLLVVCSIIDITNRKAAENIVVDKIKKLEREIKTLGKLVVTDELTTLCNRRAIFKHLELHYRIAQKEVLPLSFILADVDDFKGYNDTFGHIKGDQALKLLAGILMKSFRRTDIVGRYGGEEFGIILPSTDAKQTEIMSSRLQKELAEFEWPFRKITLSLGMATIFPRVNQTASLGGINHFISMADMALYISKRTGKNKATHFNDIETGAQLSSWKIHHDTPTDS